MSLKYIGIYWGQVSTQIEVELETFSNNRHVRKFINIDTLEKFQVFNEN